MVPRYGTKSYKLLPSKSAQMLSASEKSFVVVEKNHSDQSLHVDVFTRAACD